MSVRALFDGSGDHGITLHARPLQRWVGQRFLQHLQVIGSGIVQVFGCASADQQVGVGEQVPGFAVSQGLAEFRCSGACRSCSDDGVFLRQGEVGPKQREEGRGAQAGTCAEARKGVKEAFGEVPRPRTGVAGECQVEFDEPVVAGGENIEGEIGVDGVGLEAEAGGAGTAAAEKSPLPTPGDFVAKAAELGACQGTVQVTGVRDEAESGAGQFGVPVDGCGDTGSELATCADGRDERGGVVEVPASAAWGRCRVRQETQ